jgi:Asp-tRNA(Asn)/Glu-tRNA(Gln) amidotransferase C subunit
MLPQMIEEYGGNRELAEIMLSTMLPQDDIMYVISNETRINGASALLDNKIMDTVREKIGDDFFILPSSVHECLVVQAQDGMELRDLENMVKQVNETQVEPQDRLSDHVYQYDSRSHELFRADKAEERQKNAKAVEKKTEKEEAKVSLKGRLAEKKQQIAGERKEPAMGMGKQKEAVI